MCVLIDQDCDTFEKVINDLAAGLPTWERESDPGYALRSGVCEKSRFVWLSAMQAADAYAGVLESSGSPDGTIRAVRIDRLFGRAVELLSCQDDVFLQNVCIRQEELQPKLERALAGSTPTSS